MYIGFSCLRFLSQFTKTGLGIVPFGGTQHTYTFKQPILAAAGLSAGAGGDQRLAHAREKPPERRLQAKLPAPTKSRRNSAGYAPPGAVICTSVVRFCQ